MTITEVSTERTWHVPFSTDWQTIALPPRGTMIRTGIVRRRKGSRTIDAPSGLYAVSHITLDHSPSATTSGARIADKVIAAVTYHIVVPRIYNPLIAAVDPKVVKCYTVDHDPLFDPNVSIEDGQVWGWYGLDWWRDAEMATGDPSRGYVRLRRMVRVREGAV